MSLSKSDGCLFSVDKCPFPILIKNPFHPWCVPLFFFYDVRSSPLIISLSTLTRALFSSNKCLNPFDKCPLSSHIEALQLWSDSFAYVLIMLAILSFSYSFHGVEGWIRRRKIKIDNSSRSLCLNEIIGFRDSTTVTTPNIKYCESK